MKVIIDGKNISDIIFNVHLNEGCLSESEAITLSGRRQIDRMGDFRAALKFTVGVVSLSRWSEISESLKKLPVKVKIESFKTTEYNMSIDGEIPNPHIFSENNVDYCANMEISLKEVG